MDVITEPGKGISRDIARGEAVEKELDVFVSRRDTKRRESEGERAVEELWQVSERLHDADRRAENRAAWCRFHSDMAGRHRAVLEDLIATHEAEAERLQATNGKGAV